MVYSDILVFVYLRIWYFPWLKGKTEMSESNRVAFEFVTRCYWDTTNVWSSWTMMFIFTFAFMVPSVSFTAVFIL